MSPSEIKKSNTDAETISRSASLVISENPEVFGGLSAGFSFVKEQEHRKLMQKGIMILILVSMIPLSIIAFRIYLEFSTEGNGKVMLDIVKILFITGATFVIAFFASLPFTYKLIKKRLIEMEEVALFGRDFALFNLPIYRQQLVQLNDKLKGAAEDEAVFSGLDLVKDLVPVVKLLMARERNLLKWGMSGFKMLKNLKSFFEGKK